jgi:hypothetical protein
MRRVLNFLMMAGVLLVVTCAIARPAAAQTITTGTLSGSVEDPQGGRLPGVTVQAVHTETGTTYETVTQTDGRFSILNVRVGNYTIKATLSGFKDNAQKDIVVGLGEDKSLFFKMELASLSSTVNVTAEAGAIDLNNAGTAGNISNAVKEALPTIQRSITDIARTNIYFNPMGLNDDQPALSVAGRSQRFNSFQIDGAVNNDLFGLAAGGGTPGGSAGTQPISLDAIQELQLVVSPYDIRQSGFSGGGINAITKSGTNDLHGTGYFFGRNQSMVSKGITKVPVSDFSDYQGGASLGGPIMQNKAFYFGNYDAENKLTPTGFSVGGNGQQAFQGNEGLVNQYLADLKNLYGYSLPSSILDEYSKAAQNDKVFIRTDFNLGKSQLTIRHNYVNAFQDVGSPSKTTYTTPDDFYRFKSKTNSTVGQLTSRFGAAVNELRLASTEVREHRDPLPGFETNFPNITVTLVGTAKITSGRETFSGANQLDQTIIELTDDYTRVMGNHQITVGTHNEFFHFRNLFIRDFFGLYTFNSLAQFESGVAQTYGHSFSATSNPSQAAEFGVRHMGAYTGDQWRAASNLTVTYGVRADFVRYPDVPNANPLSLQFNYATNVVPNNTLFSPRAGFNWALKKDGTEQVRGGIGLFAGRTPYVWISNDYGNTGVDFTRLSVTTGGNANNIPFRPDPNGQYTAASQITGASAGVATNEIDLIDPNFKYPSILRGNIAYDRALPMGWYGTAELLFTKNEEDIRYANLNLQQIATSNIDGRPFYGRVNSALSDVLLLTNTDQGKSWTISFEAKRPFRSGIFVDAGYIYGRSRTIMDGTRDQALSTWGNAYTSGDVNNPPLGISDYDPGHRINITGSYTHTMFKGSSGTASIFYSGQSGRPYTVLFGGSGVNGDGQSFNDIIFLMNTAPAGVNFTNGTFQDLLNYFNSYPCMADQLGQPMLRNSCRSPWTNTLDGRFALSLPFKKVKAEVTLDVLNIPNWLNSKWGVFRYAAFNDVTPVSASFSSSTGQVTTLNVGSLTGASPFSNFTIGDLRSRGQLQIGGRIRF